MRVQELLAGPEFESYAQALNLTMTLAAIFRGSGASDETIDAAFAAWYAECYGDRPDPRRLRLVGSQGSE